MLVEDYMLSNDVDRRKWNWTQNSFKTVLRVFCFTFISSCSRLTLYVITLLLLNVTLDIRLPAIMNGCYLHMLWLFFCCCYVCCRLWRIADLYVTPCARRPCGVQPIVGWLEICFNVRISHVFAGQPRLRRSAGGRSNVLQWPKIVWHREKDSDDDVSCSQWLRWPPHR